MRERRVAGGGARAAFRTIQCADQRPEGLTRTEIKGVFSSSGRAGAGAGVRAHLDLRCTPPPSVADAFESAARGGGIRRWRARGSGGRVARRRIAARVGKRVKGCSSEVSISMNSFVSPAGRALCLRKWMARLSAWKTRCWCHGLPAPSRRWRHSTYHVLEEAVEAVVAAAGGVSCTRFDRDRAAHRSAVAHRLSSSAARVGGGARARRVNCVAVWACAWRCARASRELRDGAGLQQQRRARLNSRPQSFAASSR